MSRISNSGKTTARAFLFAAAILSTASWQPAQAQYVGHVDTNQDNNAPTLRATAVLEYTGDLTKPNASRLIPIAVWDGERYQPGGLYLAQPVPLTVETGTQYVLQTAGTPKGLFDVKGASDVGGSWIAIGTYQKPAAPTVAKLKPSRSLPRIVSDADSDKPHFAHVPSGDSNPGSGTTKNSSSNTSQASAPDSERPTLHRRTDDANSQNTSSGNSGSSTESGNAPVDPDRPILREPPKPSSNSSTAPGSEGPETATTDTDPNRPHLEYGRPADLESLDAPSSVEIAKLAGTPTDLKEIAAVSDAANRPTHSYVYSWTEPDDEKKMQAALETLAQQLLVKPAPGAITPTANSSAVHKTTSAVARKKPTPPAMPTLTDEQFTAYSLSYGSGATLVFSATTGDGDAARYITLIAQPDFNGTPLVLYKQITSQRELDVVPRMKLIDAVDTDADNRAELIFALENTTGRQYAIYRVSNSHVEQVFTTGS
jgi:hypothetical protein